jgi:hypothetical protein
MKKSKYSSDLNWPRSLGEIKTDDQNMVIILGRYHFLSDAPLESLTFAMIRPAMLVAANRADVVIIMDGNEFFILKHRFMPNTGEKYHKSSLVNIMFART